MAGLGAGGDIPELERGFRISSSHLMLAFRLLPLGRGEAEALLAEARHGAVVEQLAVVVAPAGVIDLPDLHLVDVARGQAMQQAGRVPASDLVLDQRRDVDQCRMKTPL